MMFVEPKPKLFVFGACDLHQSIKIDMIAHKFTRDLIRTEKDTLDFETCNVPPFSTSMLSLYTKPNELANRVHETLIKTKNVRRYHYALYKEIVKFPYLKYFKENAGPKDILVMNLSSELYTKIKAKSETFTIIPIPDARIYDGKDQLHWLYKEYINKDEYIVPFDDEQSLNETYDVLQDFARDVYEIFQDRVVLVKTHVTNLALGSTADIEKVKIPLNGTIPFYKPSRIMQDPLDHTYAQRATNLLLNKFRKWYKAELPIVSVSDGIFLDYNHPYGYSPFHLHISSCTKIGLNIYDELVKIKNKTQLKENIDDNTNTNIK